MNRQTRLTPGNVERLTTDGLCRRHWTGNVNSGESLEGEREDNDEFGEHVWLVSCIQKSVGAGERESDRCCRLRWKRGEYGCRKYEMNG